MIKQTIHGREMMTTEEFITEAKDVHGDTYDYSKVEYKGNNEKVLIICPEHGEFWQLPSNHKRGAGCPKCARIRTENSRRISNEEFIRRSKNVHGDKYDYSKVNYISNLKPVTIICPIHGEFQQLPSNHYHAGCPKCKNVKRKTISEFIKEAKGIHGDKYDYSKVNYVNSRTLINIVCPSHGEFSQQAYVHLMGSGCPKCGKEYSSEIQSLTFEEFIKKANLKHNSKYDYSITKETYKNASSKIKFICPEHGEVEQLAQVHLKGVGCPKCRYVQASQTNMLTLDKFIQNSIKSHGDKYDYSKVEYKGNSKKVLIICPEHGEFWQLAGVHMAGSGCPKCNQSHLENEMSSLLQEHNIKFESQKEFDWLKYKNHLKLDFYLPEYNIAIECQGIQHFREVNRFRGKDGFNDIKIRDNIKKEQCLQHNIIILYFTKDLITENKNKPNYFTKTSELINYIKTIKK